MIETKSNERAKSQRARDRKRKRRQRKTHVTDQASPIQRYLGLLQQGQAQADCEKYTIPSNASASMLESGRLGSRTGTKTTHVSNVRCHFEKEKSMNGYPPRHTSIACIKIQGDDGEAVTKRLRFKYYKQDPDMCFVTVMTENHSHWLICADCAELNIFIKSFEIKISGHPHTLDKDGNSYLEDIFPLSA